MERKLCPTHSDSPARSIGSLIVPLVVVLGCGGSSQVAQTRLSAQAAFSEGFDSFANKQYETARALLTEAIESGGLYIELYGDAYAMRAVAAAALGDTQAANADLQRLKNAPVDASLVLAAEASVLLKLGKKKEAELAWRRAKRLNPRVKLFR